ncbi:tyrosine-type recombinase/integrase [Actinacidiphila acidipaludis]|uniref:Site-specific integrase n=1 Tax=Actinacidiphila acidipaludis TaxID=2873382 RepID=A0ABS7QG96_9ACTN|nr:tyrosine-type recombinase/integrase [Streptomyces acidipaludis]MBY8881973.1 site-specific integrase [Streptomyces acidipaludis]
MAGHIQDRWYKTEPGPDGKPVKVKTDRNGLGMRYRARYIGPDGTEKSKSFPDRQRRLAEQWLAHVEADMSRGQYIDPKTSRTTFQQYAQRWLSAQTTDVSTQDSAERYLRLHALPYLGSRPLGSFKPEHVRAWLHELETEGVPGSYAVHIYGTVRAVLSAAVDDGYLARNPCAARSVRPPTREAKRVTPWLPERVFAVRAALPARLRATVDAASGCGLRQGEVLGLAEDALSFDSGTLHVVRQVKLIRGRPVFAPPKCDKERDTPLPESVADALRAHMKAYAPAKVTLPWKSLNGPLVTHSLIFTGTREAVMRRSDFNDRYWKPALVAAGVLPEPEKGEDPAAAREHGMHALRHFYASVLLEAGENVKAVSEYLGHADPAMTLRVYAHLMPSSRERTRKAIDAVFQQRTSAR